MCDIISKGGAVDVKHRGHGRHLTLVKRLAMPMGASTSIGKVLVRVHALLWLFNGLKELLTASQKIQDGVPLPAKTISHYISTGSSDINLTGGSVEEPLFSSCCCLRWSNDCKERAAKIISKYWLKLES